MKKLLMKAGWAALLAGASVAAWAANPVAVLQQPEGKVFVGQGNAMVPAQAGMPVYRGNRVVTTAGSRVTLAYAAGCALPLGASSMLTVKGAEQCKAAVGARNVQGFTSPAIGQTPEGDKMGLYIIGGALAIGLATAIAKDDDDGDRSPASP